jgi:hypothetical protein
MPVHVATSGPYAPKPSIIQTVAERGQDFEHLIVDVDLDARWGGGVRLAFKFTNGWGASVIRNPYSYGGTRGLWEMAVLDPEGVVDFHNPVIPRDPMGWLDEEKVVSLLRRIAFMTNAEVENFLKSHPEEEF